MSIDGIKVALMPSGEVFGWTSGYEAPESLARFTFDDTGSPWIPSHKGFNGLARQMARDGDFDGLLKFRKARLIRKQNMSKASEDLYAKVVELHSYLTEEDKDYAGSHAELETEALLAKARGESA
jgi:hypothetical protein